MKVFCVGLSHHETKVETRECFAGDATTQAKLRECGCSELLLLSTCNRVEVYGATEKDLSATVYDIAMQAQPSTLQVQEVYAVSNTSKPPRTFMNATYRPNRAGRIGSRDHDVESGPARSRVR